MGTAIRATAISTDPGIRSSIAHSSAAANACILEAGVSTGQIDVLINAGVYRDSNMVEPAMAALIQKEVGMNLDYVKYPTPKAGFSFDLMNGACGVLNAIQVGSAFLDSGNADHVLVVSGDAHPDGDGRAPSAEYPYATVGAAMLLERVPDSDTGFGPVRTASSDNASPGTEGYLDLAGMGLGGRQQLTVETDADYEDRLVEFAAELAREYAEAEGVDLARTLLVTSQPTPGFAAAVAQRLGLAPEAAVTLDGVDGDPHSSAVTFAYHQAVTRGQAEQYSQLLFVAAGAGLSAACVVYRPPAS
jgi:3-oxoacyl-[acyl-carrier-protein] synthase-3